MKRTVALLLVLASLLSLTGCGSTPAQSGKAAQSAPVVTEVPTEPATEPTTEPTLSPEAVLYASLTERMRQAVDLVRRGNHPEYFSGTLHDRGHFRAARSR